MAKRRCISIDIYESEEYLSLSDKAKALYTQFILRSDDEGVIINPKTAMRLCCAGKEHLSELMENGFVLKVEQVYVIRHWYVHNKIQPSRKTASLYVSQLAQLSVNQEKEYEFVGNLSTKCQHNINEENINKNNIIKENSGELNSSEEKQSVYMFPTIRGGIRNPEVVRMEAEDIDEYLKSIRKRALE